MNFILILILLLSPKIWAEVVMVPSTDQSFESYQARCSMENSQCTFTVIKALIENAGTPKYDQLILDLQLESAAFTNQLPNRLVDIVESEMVSQDQLESLINILQRSEEIFSVKKNKLLKIELSQYLELIRRSPSVENFEFIFLKKPIAAISQVKLKTLSFQPYYKKINFKGEIIADQLIGFKINRCSKSKLSETGKEYFANSSYVFTDEHDCSWSDSISGIFSDSKPSTQSQYKLSARTKNIMLWSAVAIAAGLLLSQYDMQIEY